MAAAVDPQQVWRGPFASWHEAVDQAPNSQFAWSDDKWMSRQVPFLEAAMNDSALPPRPSSLPIVAGLVDARSIVDYGGGSGWAFGNLRASCPELQITAYTVLELPDVVEALAPLPRVDPRLTYVSFENAGRLPSADLIYANAALHYAETEQTFLDTALALGPAPSLLLDGFLAHPEREFFLVQHVYGHDIPVRIPHLARSLQTLRTIGYRITSCTPMLAPVAGVQRYDLPLNHLGALYSETRRWCITATNLNGHASLDASAGKSAAPTSPTNATSGRTPNEPPEDCVH